MKPSGVAVPVVPVVPIVPIAPVVPIMPLVPALPYVLVTGNAGKLAEARRLAGPGLQAVEIDLPEIQSLDLLEVLRHKGEEAWRRLQRPLVVEEAGLELAALNGFPGPLVKWMLEATGAEALARIAQALGNSRAVARAALYFRDAERILIAEGATAGTLVLPARGPRGFGWDPVFVPDESPGRTCGELSGAEKDALSHRGRAWRNLLPLLSAAPLTPVAPPAPVAPVADTA